MIRKDKGFTLIELLVVVAIIGILSSVVLASLSSARNKGRDAAIKAGLASARAEAEIIADGLDYSAACVSGALAGSATMPNIVSNVSGNTGGTAPTCSLSANNGLVAMSAPVSNGNNWCIDNSGFNAEGNHALGICTP